MLQQDLICLSAGGRTLRHPNAMLRETGLKPYSLVTCESSVLLQGGMRASNAKTKDQSDSFQRTRGGKGAKKSSKKSGHAGNNAVNEQENENGSSNEESQLQDRPDEAPVGQKLEQLFQIDMDEFKALDEKIQKGDYSDEEQKKFTDLSLQYAQN